jgi:hypothetical protein
VVVAGVVGATVIGVILVFTGSPSACVDRDVPVSAAQSQDLRAAWDNFKAQASAGAASMSATEGQVTSRAVEFFDENSVPVEDLQVYFCPGGTAEATGSLKILGLTSNVVVEGTLDLSSNEPRVQLNSVRAGNLPSFIARPAVEAVLNAAGVRDLDIGVRLTSVQYSDGTVGVQSGP